MVNRGSSTALALVRASDLGATVRQRHTGNLFVPMYSFAFLWPSPSSRSRCLGIQDRMEIAQSRASWPRSRRLLRPLHAYAARWS